MSNETTDRDRAIVVATADAIAAVASVIVYLTLLLPRSTAAGLAGGYQASVNQPLLLVVICLILLTIFGLFVGSPQPARFLGFNRRNRSSQASREVQALVIGNLGLFAVGVHFTGGPLVSPFAPYPLGVIVLGFFLADKSKTRWTLMVVGIVLYGILTAISRPEYFLGSATEWRYKLAYFAITSLTIWIGRLANADIWNRDEPVADGSEHTEIPVS